MVSLDPSVRAETPRPSVSWHVLADALIGEAAKHGDEQLLHAAQVLRRTAPEEPHGARRAALYIAALALGDTLASALAHDEVLTAQSARVLGCDLVRLAPLMTRAGFELQQASDDEPVPPPPTFGELGAWPELRAVALSDRRRIDPRAVDTVAGWAIPAGVVPSGGMVADLAFVVSVHLPCHGGAHG